MVIEKKKSILVIWKCYESVMVTEKKISILVIEVLYIWVRFL